MDRRFWVTMVWVLTVCVPASPGFGQYMDCSTVATAPDDLIAGGLSAPYVGTLPDYPSVNVKVYVHILREDDGSGGLSQAVIDSLLDQAYIDFSSVGVYLVVDGQSDVNNSAYYANPDSNSAQIFATNGHVDGVDLYLGPFVGAVKGGAQGIPSNSVFLTGAFDTYHVLSHSLGHCFGLYDTHETIFGTSSPGASSGADGDLISDTYADPGLNGLVLSNCELDSSVAIAGYDPAPDATNIMSGGRTSCWEGFTEEQGNRMLTVFDESTEMAATLLTDPWPYSDHTVDTNLRTYYDPDLNDPSSLPQHPSNAAAFNFVGNGEKDIVVVGQFALGATADVGFAGRNSHYSNNDVPVFIDVSSTAFPGNIRPTSGTTGAIVGDYDNDGHIDFYAPRPEYNGEANRHKLYRNLGNETFGDATEDVGLDNLPNDNDKTISGSWGDYDGDGYLDLLLVTAPGTFGISGSEGSKDIRLFKNLPTGTGTDRKFVDKTSEALGSTDLKHLRSAIWADFDMDHDVDLLLVQFHLDPITPSAALSKYFKNKGDGTFFDATVYRLPNRSDWIETRGFASVGDFDNDADLDVVFHAQLRRSWYKNNFNGGQGIGKLLQEWNEIQPANGWSSDGWIIKPSGLGVFDHDLDGHTDFAVGNRFVVDQSPHLIFTKSATTSGFVVNTLTGLPSDYSEALGMCSADFNLDGYTELFLSAEPKNSLFFKSVESMDDPTDEWVGIRLEAESSSCNYRGIGATVTVSYENYTQSRLVDGGSGQASQNDIDLSFGVPGAGDSVMVDIIWPCGQDQTVYVPTGTYNTIDLDWPVVDSGTVEFETILYPGDTNETWVFTWETDYPSDSSLDMVEVVTGSPLPDGPVV